MKIARKLFFFDLEYACYRKNHKVAIKQSNLSEPKWNLQFIRFFTLEE